MTGCLDAEAAADLLAQRMPENERRAAEEHLDGCATCRRFIAALAREHFEEQRGEESKNIKRNVPADEEEDSSASFDSRARKFRSGQKLGRYLLLDIAGTGAMGLVFSAYDPELDRKVALKLLRRSSLGDTQDERLRREAQAMAKVHHPNVAQVFDVGSHEGEVFIAMEFIAGETLSIWLRESRRGWREIVDAFLKAGRGLQAAHQAGLVHRDFKPDNVLISEADRRVCVCDFGLVSPSSDASASGEISGHPSELTQAGAMLGTPAYMAPEQLQGALADERSDQFSFCVALFEGLYGKRPFAGRSIQELRESIRAANVQDIEQSSVPRMLRSTLLRGLEGSPVRRFHSMGDLLSSIESAIAPRKHRRIAVAVGLFTLLGLGILGFTRNAKQEMVCQGAEQALAGVWGDARRSGFSRAIEQGSGDAYRSQLLTKIDARAELWKRQHTNACLATRVHKHQSEEHLDLRMACLSQQRIDLQAFLREVETGAASLERALQTADGLANPAECAAVTSLDSRATALAQRNRPEHLQLRQELASVKAKMELGLAKSALTAARDLMPKLLQADAPLLIAHGHAQLGSLLEAAGHLDDSREMYESALEEAVAAGDDALVAEIWIRIVHLVGVTQGEHVLGRHLARVAEISLLRIPNDEKTALELRSTLAMLASSEGDLAQAEEGFRFVVAGYERTLGHFDPRTLNALHNLGDVLRRRGTLEEAREIWRDLLRTQEERLGPEHSSVTSTLMQLAHDEYQRGKTRQALGRYQRVLEIRRTALGPNSPKVAAAHTSVGLAMSRTGDYAGARMHHEQALAIWRSTLGPLHSNVALALNNLANTEFQDKKLEVARDLYQEAYELKKATLGAEHVSVATPLFNLGIVLKELSGRCQEAEPLWLEVLALRELGLTPEHPSLAFPLTSIGECLVERRAYSKAQPLLERALAIRVKHASAPSLTAETQFALARALWSEVSQRGRALTLAEAALANSTEPDAIDVQSQIAAWLSKRRP